MPLEFGWRDALQIIFFLLNFSLRGQFFKIFLTRFCLTPEKLFYNPGMFYISRKFIIFPECDHNINLLFHRLIKHRFVELSGYLITSKLIFNCKFFFFFFSPATTKWWIAVQKIKFSSIKPALLILFEKICPISYVCTPPLFLFF